MKPAPLIAALLFAIAGASCDRSPLFEQDETWNVDCELQVVSMPEELALPLVSDLRNPRRSEGAFKDVQKLIAEKRAILIGWPILTTKSGQRAVVEQVDEFRYATEYDPPGKTVTTESPTPQDTPADAVDPAATTEAKPAEPPPVKTTTTGISNGGPTAFETRNVGVTFEVEPVISADGEMIEMNFVPQHVRFLKWEAASLETTPGEKVTVQQPRFVTNKVTTSITFRNGERKLIGLFKAIEPAGHVELFILRVDALKRKVAVERRPNSFGGPQSGAAH